MSTEKSKLGLTVEGSVRRPVEIRTMIGVDQLPLYQQVGSETGFTIQVIAREGEQYDFLYHDPDGSKSKRSLVIEKGKLGIEITKPDGESDHAPFWQAYDRLKPAKPA